MKSLLTKLEAFARGHLILDFDFQEYPIRQTVREKYPRERFTPQYAEHIIIGKIVLTGEDFFVPPEYGLCTFGRGHEPTKKPPNTHINHPAIEELLNDPTSKTS